jgi:hypothetical protein
MAVVNMISHIRGRTQTGGVSDHGAEKNKEGGVTGWVN